MIYKVHTTYTVGAVYTIEANSPEEAEELFSEGTWQAVENEDVMDCNEEIIEVEPINQ